MQEFDSNANEGSRLLLSGPAPDAAQVDDVRQWATEQSARLSGMRSTIPAQDKADESLALLNRVLGETDALQKAACDPAAGPCPTVRDGEPTEGDTETGPTLVPDATVPGTTEDRTTTRGGAGRADDDGGRRHAVGGRRAVLRRPTTPTTTRPTTGAATARAARAGPAVRRR